MMAESKDREVRPLPEAEAQYRAWVAHLDGEFKRQESPERRAEIVRDELYEMYLGRPHGGRTTTSLISETAIFVLGDSLDVRNVSLDADYASDGDIDQQQYAPRRPLIWFWQMFDRSPLGLNLWLGFRFRCMLGQHLFKKLGKGVKIYPDVKFALGYNLTIEDNCTIGRGAVLEDTGGELVIPQGTNIAAGTKFSRAGNG
jgi:hypothetical protein